MRYFVRKRLRLQRSSALGLLRRQRPDHRNVLARQGQQCEHCTALEPLISRISVRLFAAEIGDERGLPVVALRGCNAGGAAHEGACAVGADHEPRLHGIGPDKHEAQGALVVG